MPLTRAVPKWLAGLGLHRPELRAWVVYDWAISAVYAVMSAVFPIYFVKVAGADLSERGAMQWWSTANAVGFAVMAVLGPLLGALADRAALKKRLMALCMAIGASALVAMCLVQRGDMGLVSALFVLVSAGTSGSMMFYLSLLPHLTRGVEVARVATVGYAFGNVGGCLLLVVSLVWLQSPDWLGRRMEDPTLSMRRIFVATAVWWVLFSLPAFLRISEPPRTPNAHGNSGGRPVGGLFTRWAGTLRALRGYRHAFLLLLAFMLYNGGMLFIVQIATAYGAQIGIGQGDLIVAVLLAYLVGAPFTVLFGKLAERIGAKPSLFVGLLTYTALSVLGYFMRTATHLYVLATLVGMVTGGMQSLSRSLFSSMIPRHRSAEFFGLYGLCEKLAGIFSPLFFAVAMGVMGSIRMGILSVSAFFVVGAALLAFVNLEAGMRAVQEETA